MKIRAMKKLQDHKLYRNTRESENSNRRNARRALLLSNVIVELHIKPTHRGGLHFVLVFGAGLAGSGEQVTT